jgi:predicted regulator of Ras-like GTPase activity (Roadblock/LC7/MglB family)
MSSLLLQQIDTQQKKTERITTMLQPRVLPKIIEQANTDGVKTTLLLKTNGSLLASAGGTKEMDKLVAAIVANVWSSYSKAGRTAFNAYQSQNQDSFNSSQQQKNFAYDEEDDHHLDEEDDMMDDHHPHRSSSTNQNNEPLITEKLSCLLVDCEAGRLAITGVSPKVILCLCADKQVEFGLLKAKALVVKNYLVKPFETVEAAEE